MSDDENFVWSPTPPDTVLEFWKSDGHVGTLRRTIKIALSDGGVRQSRFADIAEEKFCLSGMTGLKDALGRFARSSGVPGPAKCHVFVVTLFYVFQRLVTDDLKEQIARQRSLFHQYDEVLSLAGFPQTLAQLAQPKGLTPSDGNVDPKYPKVVLKEGMSQVPPLDFVLGLVNVDESMHGVLNRRFFNTMPHRLVDHEYQWFVVVTLPPGTDQFHLSLLVLRSGHQRDAAMTYTHRQRRARAMEGQSTEFYAPRGPAIRCSADS